MLDAEAAREALRKELANVQRKLSGVEEALQQKAREHQSALQHHARSDQQAVEQRLQLETAVETAGVQLAELRVELEAAGGRVEALETQLGKTEACLHDAEMKLSNVVSALRRTVGILPADVTLGQRTRSRSSSPRKGQW